MNEGPEFFSIGIGEYAEFSTIPVETEIERVKKILDRFGSEAAPAWTALPAERGGTAVTARLEEWSKSSANGTFFYWLGHGLGNSADFALAHRDSPKNTTQGMNIVAPIDIAHAARKRDPDVNQTERWAMIIIDACKSAGFVQKLSAEIDRLGEPRRMLLIASSQIGSSTIPGVLSRALEGAVSSFRTEPRVSLERLAHEVKRQLGGPGKEVVVKDVNDVYLINHWAVPKGMVVSGDQAPQVEEVMADLTKEERATIEAAGSGAEIGSTSWFFTGRIAELNSIFRWLAGDEKILVVTGAPGTGKSALLGNLLIRMNPSVWRILGARLPPVPDLDIAMDSVRPFAAVLRLTGTTLVSAIDRLADRLNVQFPVSASGVNDRIEVIIDAMKSRSSVIFVDALDEAAEPIEIGRALISRLARDTDLRFVVGTRPSTSSQLDAPVPRDADLVDSLSQLGQSPRLLTIERDGAALGKYVTTRLNSAMDAGFLISKQRVAEVAAKVERDAPDFLLARMVIIELISAPSLADELDIDRLIVESHGPVFDHALRRLQTKNPQYMPLLRALASRRGRGFPVGQGVWLGAAAAFSPEGAVSPPNNSDCLALTRDASPYLLLDSEFGRTVYRLSHQSFESQLLSEG